MSGRLTKKEQEIAELITWGASAKEIALILNRKTNTIARHIKNIKRKLGINKSTEISAYIFCTEYNVPIAYDKIGNIKKIISMCVCFFLIGLAEFQQMDCLRIRTVKPVSSRTIRTSARKAKKESYEEYSLIS